MALRRHAVSYRPVLILVFSSSPCSRTMTRSSGQCVQGARGYIIKGAGKDEVMRAITVVAHGEAIFSPQIAQRLMQYFTNMRPVIPEQAFPDLTDREREVLSLIVDGKTNAQIADILALSPKTVSNHISNIFSKLQVVDR